MPINIKPSCFTYFEAPISSISLPEKFTFPFYYEPHPIALLAARELQEYILHQKEWFHDFGLKKDNGEPSIGKMFGVLVVKNEMGEIGYLSGFSGKLADKSHHSRFVPPIYDRLKNGSYFDVENKKLDAINKQIIQLESNPRLLECKQALEQQTKEYNFKIGKQRSILKKNQKERQATRKEQKNLLSAEEYLQLQQKHEQENLNDHFLYREYGEYLQGKLALYQQAFYQYEDEISALKNNRKLASSTLQDWLFTQYDFVNSTGEIKNVLDIFKHRIPNIPPSGTGDCAAPKMLQYAFRHHLKPIALAEFWWGKSPSSEVRKHGYFYPACRGKCEPILGHMLQGITTDPNPMLENMAVGKEIDIIYEDDSVAVINKPAEFLSVPGKNVFDSVQERMKVKYPSSTGPLIVHRLDMSTSGLMVIPKSKKAHQILQEQFKSRKINKRYVALLDGEIEGDSGFIDLPIRLDIDNRPFQMVCYEHGKPSRTKWEVIERYDGKTKVYFYPITGRTHQLRVHAAHHLGLNAPIVGDDLYGIKGERLHLHAESIGFVHPMTKELISLQVDAEF